MAATQLIFIAVLGPAQLFGLPWLIGFIILLARR
jgi:hypothetical protein